MDDQLQQAVEIGQQNAHLISLAKAWCTHVRADREGWGIGLVEEMTGLPVTGGRLTCDFARRPARFAGMQLQATALEFFEDNCKGCTDRAPGNRTPNLSTWAEPLIAERDEWQQAQESNQRAEFAARQRRADHRTLVAASLPAAVQEIIGLINRIDLDPSDTDAQESLRSHARLAGDTFSNEVKEVLHSDARSLRSAIMLEVLLSVDASAGAQLHDLCLSAVREGWGASEGCRYLSEHGLASDLDDDLIDAVVSHAAPSGVMMLSTPGSPAALLRYYSVAPDAIEQRVKTLLRHGDGWRRAIAAAASQALISRDATCGARLLPALLDGLRHQEDIDEGHDAASTIGTVVAEVVLNSPDTVAAVVGQRWGRASPEYRSRIIDCYESMFRRGRVQLPDEVARTAIALAVTALSEPLNAELDGPIDDFQGMASELLEGAVQASPTEAIQLDVLVGLLFDWLERDRSLDRTESADFIAALQQMSAHAAIGRVVRNVANAVVILGQRNPTEFVSLCDDLYSGAETTPLVRAEVVRIAGRVAAGSGTIDCALPLIYSAMLGEDQAVRAAGMEAAERVMRSLPYESVPPLLAQAVIAGLSDRYLIVIMAAIKAAREVPPDLIDHRAASVVMLSAARAYASDRMRDHLVDDAVRAVHHLASEDDQWLGYIRVAVLEIIGLMPAFNARKALRRRMWLEPDANWSDTAIHALRVDENPQYEHLGDDDKEVLLRKLGQRRLTSPQIEMLTTGELDASKRNWRRSLLAAEMFSELGRPDISAQVIQAHLLSVPDTIEKQPRRRSIEEVLLVYRCEEAIASGRSDARREVVDRAEELCAGQ